jgi:hypothetical protein
MTRSKVLLLILILSQASRAWGAFPVRNSWSGTAGSFSVTTSGTLPVVGDMLIFQSNIFEGTNACPSGFTSQEFCQSGVESLQVCTKVAVSGDTSPTTYTSGSSGSGPQVALLDLEDIVGIDVLGACKEQDTGNVTATGITTNFTDFILWSAGVTDTTGDNTAAPAGYTALYNIAWLTGTNVNLGMNYDPSVGAGSTGNIADSDNYTSVYAAALTSYELEATQTPTPSTTATPTVSATPTATLTATASATATTTPTPTPTLTPTPSATVTATLSPTATATATTTATPSATPTAPPCGFVSASSIQGSGFVATIPRPAGIQAGDTLHLNFCWDRTGDPSPIADQTWNCTIVNNQDCGNIAQTLCWREATGSEPSNYNFTFTPQSTNWAAGITDYTNIATPTSPIDATGNPACSNTAYSITLSGSADVLAYNQCSYTIGEPGPPIPAPPWAQAWKQGGYFFGDGGSEFYLFPTGPGATGPITGQYISGSQSVLEAIKANACSGPTPSPSATATSTSSSSPTPSATPSSTPSFSIICPTPGLGVRYEGIYAKCPH